MGIGAAIIGGAALAGVGAVASSVVSSSAASKAASEQANAEQAAINAQTAAQNTVEANTAPYIAAGTNALPILQQMTGTAPTASGAPGTGVGPLTQPFQPTVAQLQSTPGYNFTLNQGLEATQNGFAAQGLGTSGAAVKGAANYAENLAATTYQQQFNNYWAQNQSIYNELGGIVGTGQNAALGIASPIVQSGANIAGSLGALGQAQASGTVGSANAITGGLSSLSGSASNYALLSALSGQGSNGLFTGSGLTPTNQANYLYGSS